MAGEPDVVIIGSGMGGSTLASGIAASGANILILEAGERLEDRPENRDQRAIFQRGHFRPKETWYEKGGQGFNPGNYYNVGGNTKFYGAVLVRYRREDFEEMQHLHGVSPAWPFPYEELEPWYSQAEQLFQVRGALGQDPTEPFHSKPYAFPPVPDEPAIAKVRKRLQENGMHTYSLPLGVDIDKWLAKGNTPWDAHPNSFDGKMDAETISLANALQHPNVRLKTGARVTRLETAFGTLVMKAHPLFTQMAGGLNGATAYRSMDSTAVILDMAYVKYVYLQDVEYEKDLAQKGLDGMKSGYLAECSMEINFPQNHWIINGLTKAKKDA